MVDRAIATVGRVTPQHTRIHRQNHATATAQQIGQATFVVSGYHIISDVVAVQNIALVIHIGATQLVSRQVGIGDRPVVVNRQIDHLALRCWLARLGEQVGNRCQCTSACKVVHRIALHVVQFVALGIAIHQHILAVHQTFFWFGKIQQHQIFDVGTQCVADA